MTPPPQAQITPPPTRSPLPARRQDLSSFYAAMSSINVDQASFDASSFMAAWSSANEFDYSSFFEHYSTTNYDFNSLLVDLTGTVSSRRVANTGLAEKPTISAAATSESAKSGLSTAAKIGIGIGVVAILGLLAGFCIFLFCAGKRRGKKKRTTIVAPNTHQTQTPFIPPAQPYQPQPNIYAPNQGYTPGYQRYPSPSPLPLQPPNVNPNVGGYAKGPDPGVVELDTEYHFARGGAVEIGDSSEPAVEEEEEDKKKKGWQKMIGRKPVPGS
ncbi:hypothetical protein K504DRAFT_467764 [Pleomassaria siparia CBS 279.74]|uniref:Mid2 domain-containing protein n=1 Tax=Pleomassaria siparia CBS 279.74 TaxID=1314801 RepID=A0A6G1KAH7_9PLEO|nr:hypothetical protein K504DRAFT_467764 [Pleomassaria siparia CBS 279.74]